MRSLFVLPLALFAAVQSADAQGFGINLGPISINIGGSDGSGGGVGVAVGGTGVSIGANGVSVGGTSSTVATTSQPVELSQQAAVDAVGARRALPLEVILAKARALSDGEVIDAKLISYGTFLLYDLKVLAATGDVSELYFYARSGVQVQAR